MATRIEKIYKSNSIKTFNTVLNYVNDYVQTKKKMGEKERELCENVATEIDYFFNKNDITDEEIRAAVNRGDR